MHEPLGRHTDVYQRETVDTGRLFGKEDPIRSQARGEFPKW
jgi:hypothetical protein